MSTRKYIGCDINELESLVDENLENPKLLKEVEAELSHRKQKKKTIALQSKIELAIANAKNPPLIIRFPDCWINEDIFENTLQSQKLKSVSNITFELPENCNIMIGPAIKLLSLLNQLANQNKKIVLSFAAGTSGTMGYLKRMEFFDHLDKKIKVSPPLTKTNSNVYHGKNDKLVEIERIDLDNAENDELPEKLANSVIENAAVAKISASIKNKIKTAITTKFSELTDNVRLHSKSQLPAFAACQIYKPQNEFIAHVAVADSGVGLLTTLRPELSKHYPKKNYQLLSDTDLILEMFKQGLSRRGSDKGCGLVTCAIQALKLNATVSVRIKDSCIKLSPTPSGYVIDVKTSRNKLIDIDGTTITFEFNLGALTG